MIDGIAQLIGTALGLWRKPPANVEAVRLDPCASANRYFLKNDRSLPPIKSLLDTSRICIQMLVESLNSGLVFFSLLAQ